MKYDLTQRLVVGLSSSALFDLAESDAIFREKGESAYREYQRKYQDEPLKTGVAYPFIRRLLSLNALDPNDAVVDVILLSRNDPDTGLRVMNSIEHYGLGMTRAVFLQGKSPYQYIPALSMDLFLSANPDDVLQAVNAGYAAGQILPGNICDDIEDPELRLAFDFDGVIADDEAEAVFQKTGSIDEFHQHEVSREKITHNPGPLKGFLKRISDIQKQELKRQQQDSSYDPILRVSIVTARSAPSHKRVVNTMREWDIMINEAFFMGGVDKSTVLSELKPHIFFDDQRLNLDSTPEQMPAVHIPFGIANNRKCKSDK